MVRGPGTIIKQNVNRFRIIREGKNCWACDELADEWDKIGPDAILDDLEAQTDKFVESAATWKRENGSRMPTPRPVLKNFLRWACNTSIKEQEANKQ